MVKSSAALSAWVIGGCPKTYAELLAQGYRHERGTLFEGWELYDKKGHHVDNLYFDANVKFYKGWPKDFERISNADPVVEAMVRWHASHGSHIEHGLFSSE